MTSLPTVQVEYLPTAEPGSAATLRLGIPKADLEQGFEFWIRGTKDGPYQVLRSTTEALAVVWQGDLQLLELVCFSPQSRRFFICREYLRRQPTTEIHVKAMDHAVAYVSQPDTATDLWEEQDIPGHAGGWRPLEVPRAEFLFEPEVRHNLLALENGRVRPAKHVAVTFEPELTVGRLHLGGERHRNQSRHGAHWHLGWQRVAAVAEGHCEEVTGKLLEKTRDWMSRSAGTLRMAPTKERLDLQAISSGPPEEFQIRQRGNSTWDLELIWSNYSDQLQIHAEEASGQLDGRAVQLPWFWAARQQIVPELEDRFYLWLPGWEQDFQNLVGVGGWLGSEIRWFVENGCLVFLDAGEINQRGRS